MSKKIILSGIQATGSLTLGNYLGAITNFVKMQEEYDCYYMIADLHALTIRNNPEELRDNTLKVIALYLAAGINPEKSTIFIQSHLPEHSQLSWILNCYTYMGELSRMTQFKDKSAKHADNINSGLFTYPVLMASDILLYRADIVPVGEDQKQHLEITRDIAERFNKIYGDTFKIPEGYIPKTGARIMGLQDPTSKMSKSSQIPNDTILLIDTPEEIMKKVKKAKTDSDGVIKYDIKNKPGISNLLSIYSIISGKTIKELETIFYGVTYGEFKKTVGEAIVEELRPIQDRYNKIINDKEYLKQVYTRGAENASKLAKKTLREVYQKIGLLI